MTANRKEELAAELQRTREQISEFAEKFDRAVPQLLPVTKFYPAVDIKLLHELGIEDVGENREQEARAKAAELPMVRFHMIGQIQSKKANHVARWASSVHSLDSVKLANGLERGVGLAKDRGQRSSNLPVFIQYSADADTQRGGAAPRDIPELVEVVEEAEHLDLAGFMVVPPLAADAREVFERVRSLCDDYANRLRRDLLLSAGMSADLESAIAAGTDIVRVGTGIMGPRPVG